MTPFFLTFSQDELNAPSTVVIATSDPVPAGKLFVVEHISGVFTVGKGKLVDQIWAQDPNGQQIYLPTHFHSRELNFGGGLGIGVNHQFGSPARMYVGAGVPISVTAQSDIAAILQVCAVGHLINA